MRWIAIAAGIIVALVAVVVGYLLPMSHVASRSRELTAPPDTVWRAITDIEAMPRWRPDISSVEMLPASDGRVRWREVGSNGTITFETVESSPPTRLVSRIADETLPFGGSWTYVLTPAAAGTRLEITENGEVRTPVFRFMSRFVFGHHATMDAYLVALDAHLRHGARAAAPSGAR
jgi:uncharacterized protein YndB with AHSA1/START domain